MYAKMLALLQLEADDLHAVWPMTHGGEARFRRNNKAILATWARIGREQSVEIEKAEAAAPANITRSQVRASVPENYACVLPQQPRSRYTPQESWRQSPRERHATVNDVRRYWQYLHQAMTDLCTPAVVMSAAMAALRMTAVHWDFAQTSAMKAVLMKCEERLPLTFGDTKNHLALGTGHWARF